MIVAAIPALSLVHAARHGSGKSPVRRTNYAYLSDGRGRLWVGLVELRHVQVLDTVRIH
ncbi:hypothetical protein AZSI13_07720 [Azospira sp. I13]|nr:hypothetical protein AZSI13_07720 [Azospira sp. I13]